MNNQALNNNGEECEVPDDADGANLLVQPVLKKSGIKEKEDEAFVADTRTLIARTLARNPVLKKGAEKVLATEIRALEHKLGNLLMTFFSKEAEAMNGDSYISPQKSINIVLEDGDSDICDAILIEEKQKLEAIIVALLAAIEGDLYVVNGQPESAVLTEPVFIKKEDYVEVVKKRHRQVTLAETIRLVMEERKVMLKSDERDTQEIDATCNDLKSKTDRFLNSNLLLIMSVYNKYFKNLGIRVTEEDLFQQATLALMKALDRFEPERNLKFSTFVTHWMRQHMRHEVMWNNSNIRRPQDVWQKIGRISQATRKLTKELGRPPDVDELAEELKIGAERLVFLMGSGATVSLSTPVGSKDGETDSTLADFFADSTFMPPDEGANLLLLRANFDSLLSELAAKGPKGTKCAEIIRLRYFTDNGVVKAHKLVGMALLPPITGERVRQLEVEAFDEIRKLVKILGLKFEY